MYEFVSQPDMPISVSALRDHCRVYGPEWDTQLTRSWYAATYDIEKRSNVLLRPCQIRETRRGLPGLVGHVLALGPADRSSVVIRDADGTELTGWYIDPNAIEPTICFNDRGLFESDQNYTIDYTAGFSVIPNDLMIAALELTAHHFENRESTTDAPIYPVSSSTWSILQNYGRSKV